jgi:hypothetical protein
LADGCLRRAQISGGRTHRQLFHESEASRAFATCDEGRSDAAISIEAPKPPEIALLRSQ